MHFILATGRFVIICRDINLATEIDFLLIKKLCDVFANGIADAISEKLERFITLFGIRQTSTIADGLRFNKT